MTMNVTDMTLDGSSIMESYNFLMVDLRDPRVDTWPLMASIWPTTLICIIYVYVVKVAGPKFMENREPYEIRKLMIVYNAFQTVFSFWMFKESWAFFVTGDYSWHCQPVDYSNNDQALRILRVGWWYFFSKFVDLLDTVFFIMRKKFNQVSPLHVIHHSTLPWLSWWGPRFVGGGHAVFGPFLNSGVHTVMYFYYLCAAFGPEVQKYLWWKKYITTIQLVQFVLVFFHAIQPLFFECNFPRAASLMFAGTGLQYFILFSMFYKKTYNTKKTDKAKRQDSTEDLLEDLGNEVERVRRNSLKVVERVRRNSITALGNIRRNSVGRLPPILSHKHLKELEKLHSNGKSEKED